MKKRTIILLSLSLFVVVWCNINKEIEKENIVENNVELDLIVESKNNYYENKLENFVFEFPNNWIMEENKYWFNVIISTPKDDEINENVWVSVQRLQKFLSIQEYYEKTSLELKEALIWFKEIESQDIKKWTLSWKRIKYEHTSWDKNLISEQTFLISPENVVYIINYTATKQTFDTFLTWVNIISNSFNIK